MRIRALVLAAALGLAACASAVTPPSSHAPVIAAETFLADIARNVAGDRLQVESLLMPGVDPHEFQATPQDIGRLVAADLVIINGLGYETWLQRSLENTGGTVQVLEASAGLPAGPNADPHLWMSPRNVIDYVENIQEGLSQLDPDGSETYAANAASYIARLRELDTWIISEVATVPPPRRVLVTNHDALGTFAGAYGFEAAGVIVPSQSSSAASSPQGMIKLIQTIESLGVPAIFLDISENPDLARQIAEESGAKVVSGLYVETLSEATGPAATYIDMMRYDVQLIVEALQ